MKRSHRDRVAGQRLLLLQLDGYGGRNERNGDGGIIDRFPETANHVITL